MAWWAAVWWVCYLGKFLAVMPDRVTPRRQPPELQRPQRPMVRAPRAQHPTFHRLMPVSVTKTPPRPTPLPQQRRHQPAQPLPSPRMQQRLRQVRLRVGSMLKIVACKQVAPGTAPPAGTTCAAFPTDAKRSFQAATAVPPRTSTMPRAAFPTKPACSRRAPTPKRSHEKMVLLERDSNRGR